MRASGERAEAARSGRDAGVEILLEGALGRTGGPDAPAAIALYALLSLLLLSPLQKCRDVGPRRDRAYVTPVFPSGFHTLPRSPPTPYTDLLPSRCIFSSVYRFLPGIGYSEVEDEF